MKNHFLFSNLKSTLILFLILNSFFSLMGCLQTKSSIYDLYNPVSESSNLDDSPENTIPEDSIPSSEYPDNGELPYSSGEGTSEKPYIISTLEDYQLLLSREEDWDKNFKLSTDLDFSLLSSPIVPLGRNTLSGTAILTSVPFSGVFDGNNKTISNIVIQNDHSATQSAGLFGSAENAIIKNLNINNISISSVHNSAVLIGYAKNTSVQNISITNATMTVSTTATNDQFHDAGVIGLYELTNGAETNIENIDLDLNNSNLAEVGAGFISRINISNYSKLNLLNNNINSTISNGSIYGNTISGGVGYISVVSGTLVVINNTVSSTISTNNGGSFSGGFIGTTSCSSCTINISNNRANINMTNPASFNAGYVGGFLGHIVLRNGSSLTLTKNTVEGNLNILSTVANRTGIGGFIGYLNTQSTLSNTAYIENNLSAININNQSLSSTNGSNFIGALSNSGQTTLLRNISTGVYIKNSFQTSHGGIFGSFSGNTLITTGIRSYYNSSQHSAPIGTTTTHTYLVGITEAQFANTSNFGNLDFSTVWQLNSSYPTLR